MTKFIVKGAVKYNDKLYNSGSIVEVEEKDVEEFKHYGWQIIEENKPQPKQEQKVEEKIDFSKLNKVKLCEELDKRGIAYDASAKKADLLALLEV